MRKETPRIRKQQKEKQRSTKNKPGRQKDRRSRKGMQNINGEREIEAERNVGESAHIFHHR